MRVEDFEYSLPDELIAQTPIEPRDAARLLVDRGSSLPEHRRVCELTDLLRPGDLLVVNDTRVIPARLLLQRATGGAAEVLLLEPIDGERTWEALIRPGRKLKPGTVLFGADGVPVVEIGTRRGAGETAAVTILGDDDPLTVLERLGRMPLPPYIAATLNDAERYQTVYARRPASSAAPTAGLHLTPALIGDLANAGISMARVELVVGLDTFKPITTADPTEHPMHSERFSVPPETAAACSAAQRVVAVGTTSVRALESAAALGTATGRTSLFIHRPYPWQVVDLMLTNFHLPRTTLLMMIDAFVGDRWRTLYETAIKERYRMLSFGDAMLLDRWAA